MATQITVDLSQNVVNALTAVANRERANLIPKNNYFENGNEYSSVNKDAIADGDNMGRGTGGFLDVYNDNAGTIVDITERKNEEKINKYNDTKVYPDF